jgi:hypothetical protein
VGSRDYSDLRAVWRFVATLPAGAVVVSGGARGVDQAAEAAARARPDLPAPVVHRVSDEEWRLYGKRAGPMRNRRLVGDVHYLIAFWDGASRGTRDSIEYARSVGKPVYLA